MTSSRVAKKRRLVLFDIDGTLVTNAHRNTNAWKRRMEVVFSQVYGIQESLDVTVANVNGLVDRQVFWRIAQQFHINRAHFLEKLDSALFVFHRELKKDIVADTVRYIPILDAVALVQKLTSRDHFAVGLVTGNTEKNGWLKLKNAGIGTLFSFGAFSDMVESRIDLVRYALTHSQAYFNESFEDSETVIIGDTIHDITAGKAVGAITIGVASGITHTLEDLQKEQPRLAVPSLLHPDVLTFFSL